MRIPDLICRALAAFKTGRRPSGRPQPVGIIGITFPLGSDESLVAYLVLSDTAVRQDTVILKGKKEEAAGTELLASLKAGKQPPKNNVLAAMARSKHDAPPSLLAERFMLVPLDEPAGRICARRAKDSFPSASCPRQGSVRNRGAVRNLSDKVTGGNKKKTLTRAQKTPGSRSRFLPSRLV